MSELREILTRLVGLALDEADDFGKVKYAQDQANQAIEALIDKKINAHIALTMAQAKEHYTKRFNEAIGEDEEEHKRAGMPDRAFDDGYEDGRNQLRAEARAKWQEGNRR